MDGCSGSSTGNLIKHIKNKHPTKYSINEKSSTESGNLDKYIKTSTYIPVSIIFQ